MTEEPHNATQLMRRLHGWRILARATLLFERVWPALWPAIGVAGVFVCLALLDLPRYLPPLLHLGLLTFFAAAIIVLLVRGLRGIAPPDDAAADRRLEVASDLRHRPLSVITDQPVGNDPSSDPIWRLHVARALAQLRHLRVGLPRPGLARRDPRALRGALLVTLIAAAIIAGPDAPGRLAQAFIPTMPHAASAPGTEIQAWITPPAYTRLAPIFLHADTSAVTAPAGSHLTVSVTGSARPIPPTLALNGHATAFHALDTSSFQADQDLTAGGHLAVRRDGGEMAGWDLTIVADRPPTAAWTEPPGEAGDGQHIRLPWTVTDDYGVVGLQAELQLRDRPSAPPMVIAVPLPGGDPKSAHGISQQDLTAHPWAGLPVIARLIARDAPGQTGESAAAEIILPERHFTNPVARALIAARRGLSLHPEDRDAAVGVLDSLLQAPQAFGTDFGAYANLSSLYYLMQFDHTAGAIDQEQQGMWQLALHMEEGLTERTARELEEARQAATDALDRAQKDPASQANRDELQKRLAELENAIQHHLQALLDELRRSPDEMPIDPNAMMLNGRQMERLAEAARKSAEQGKMDDAQRQMAQLDKMLDDLRNARAAPNAAAARNAEQRQRGRQQMSVVQDMITRQGGLLDHAQQRAEPVPRFGANQSPTQAQDPNAARQADQRVQQALRRALGELMQRFTDLTGKLPPSLGEADTDMRAAGDALGQGQDQAAGTAEQQAIAALQKGGREMGQTMAQQFGKGQGGQNGEAQDGEGDDDGMGLTLQDGQGDWNGQGAKPGSPSTPDSRRDPFGRRYGQGGSGSDESSTVSIPEQREQQRTQDIEQELRKRGADRTRPQYELDYIGRLLQQF